MVNVPLQGTPGVFDPRNPTLIPNFNRPVQSTGGLTLDAPSPGAFVSADARTDATANALIGGTASSTDTVALTITGGSLPDGAITNTYTVAGGDTTTTIAEGLAALINSNATLQAANIFASMGGLGGSTDVVVHWNGPVGNTGTISGAVSGGGSKTETITVGKGTIAVASASAKAIISGATLNAADTVALTLTNAGVTGLPITNTFTLAGTESVSDIASGLKTIINANTILAAASITALSSSGTVTISQPGTIGNTTTLSSKVNGTGDEVVTLSPVGGVFTGGTGAPGGNLIGGGGPVVATGNFQFAYGGTVSSFFYGQPYDPSYDMLLAMVNQGQPIV